MDSPQKMIAVKLRYTLSVYIALVFSSVFFMSYFFDGSSIASYLCKQLEIARVNDANIEAYSDQLLYGDPIQEVPEDIDLSATADDETGFLQTEMIRNIDAALILTLTICAWLMLIPKLNHIRYLSFIYVIFGSYLAALAIFQGLNGGEIFSELAMSAQATRWLPCFALWMLLFYRVNMQTPIFNFAIYLLILACSLTFATHGYEAFMEHPKFKDLLYGSFEIISINPSETLVITLLKLIGIMDIVLAISVICFRYQYKWLFLWMSAWGFLTAISRTTAFGELGIDDTFLRFGNGFIPLIVYYLIRMTQSQPNSHDKATI